MRSDRRIALDFEGVCADIHAATYERSGVLSSDDDDYETWGFETDDRFEEFMRVSESVWKDEWESVEPCDPNLAEHVRMLRESHEVQILTNRDGCDDELKAWLDHHDIEVDGFRSNPPTTDKSGFEKSHQNPKGFDFYIDDSPSLAFTVNRMFLVDQPYNQHVEEDDKEVIRVGNSGKGALIEVLNELYAGPIRE